MVYQGGKSKYTQYIVPIIQEAIDKSGYTTFIDGCCGGCAIIDKIKCNNKIAIDNNPYLIAFLDYISKNGTGFIPEIPPSKQEWEAVKNNKNNYPKWYVGFIEHLCSFNGRGFIGGYGVVSKLRNSYGGRRMNIIQQAKNLSDIYFVTYDINKLRCKNCVIYIDPPYNNTKKYDSLVGKPFDYEEFWNTARYLSTKNLVFISEQEAPDDFHAIWSKEITRKVKDNLKVTTENLFVYKEGNIYGTLY